MGVRVCLEGVSSESERMVEDLEAIGTRLFDEEITRLQAGALKQSPHIQWFHARDTFLPDGVKVGRGIL